MALRRLALTNYRCFAERQELELRPITVVLGKNNSGKSALVRAPLVIATGFDNDSPAPLDLLQLGDGAPDFIDLIHKRLEHGSIGIELHLEGSWQLSATVQNIAEWQTQIVSKWKYEDPDGWVSLDWLDVEDVNESDERPYRVQSPAHGWDERMDTSFTGLIPPRLSWPVHLRSIVANIDEIRHLGPFRTRPSRLTRPSARPPVQDEFGSRTAEILIHDHIRRGGRLIDKVNEYLDEHLPGWELEVVPRYDAYSVGLKSTTTRGLWVPATDSGTGVAQVLPILVQRAQDALHPPQRSVLEIVEEPELHMHPSAQAALADLYVTAIRHAYHVRFLIETHSETFLLRLRRRVAEGKLRADQLALYFVDSDGESSHADRIDVDDFGNVSYWPEGIFAENFEEVRALAEAQQERLDADAR
ncbi:Protein of unknown function [Thermomonospora echinospora]|uniref:AAA ATPase domain-containing protein n=1 Tax=Thermomonospora echinospora TaxID=1992 RepID=A0A1H5T7P5_9ACTN|nr:DUF3696 domain-containing protein [Thermomonospora echinospora]SEF58121.1 Protein of unknown function [Thermomonospora echinospora]